MKLLTVTELWPPFESTLDTYGENHYFLTITGPSKETYLLIGEPKGLPVLAGSDEDTKQLVGP